MRHLKYIRFSLSLSLLCVFLFSQRRRWEFNCSALDGRTTASGVADNQEQLPIVRIEYGGARARLAVT